MAGKPHVVLYLLLVGVMCSLCRPLLLSLDGQMLSLEYQATASGGACACSIMVTVLPAIQEFLRDGCSPMEDYLFLNPEVCLCLSPCPGLRTSCSVFHYLGLSFQKKEHLFGAWNFLYFITSICSSLAFASLCCEKSDRLLYTF